MKPNLVNILSGIVLSTTLSAPLHATENKPDDHEHHESEQHGSHEHGQARLTIATTETGLEIMLETPAANIFGFEHPAGNDDEHHIVHEAAKKLNAGDTLFMPEQAAECALDKASITSDIIDQHNKEKHADEGDEHHDEHHDKEKPTDEDDDHHHEHHDKEKPIDEDDDHHEHHDKKATEDKNHDHQHSPDSSHNDIDVTWVFKCRQPESVSQLETRLFKTFPQGFERLNVEWITAGAAGAVQLETDGVITFK